MKVSKVAKRGRYCDGLGLWLQVSEYGTKAWLFRYGRAGRQHQMGLGSVHTVSLAEARERAATCRKLLLDGVDPISAKIERRAAISAAASNSVTFKECAERYIAAHEAGWKSKVHRAQWRSTLETYAFPSIGAVPIGALDTTHVLKVVEPIWNEITETANRVRGRIEAIVDWAKARELRSGENPARWRGHLENLLPAKSKIAPVKHHAALPYRDLPKFMLQLREQDGVSAKCLEFAILNASRTGEAIGARWSEIDLRNRVWTIPGQRMKEGREHRVPLSPRSIAILSSIKRAGEFVFAGGTSGDALSNMALLKLLERMNRGDLTTHGFRSTFRDWAAEATQFSHEVAEMALSHAVGDKVEAAYRRGDLFEKRRHLAEAWARYCASKRRSK